MNARLTRLALAGVLAAALAGCGGGGGNGPLPLPSAAPQQANNVQFVMHIPAIASSSTAVKTGTHTMDFSASTQSVTIALGKQILTTADVSSTSALCAAASGGGRTCTVGVYAAPGSDRFTITAYDQPKGAGNPIATATVQATVTAQLSKVNVAVSGTITKLEIALSNAYPPVGTAASVQVAVTGLDADGNVVLGSYASPVTLTDSDTSGATTLSTSTLSGSSSTATLTYTGAAPFTSAKIAASMPGVGSASAVFAPTPAFLNAYQLGPVPGSNTMFPEKPGPWNIAKGPDGNMWVAATGYSEIIKVAPDGTMTTYPLSNTQSMLQGIVLGSDGNLWFAENGNNAIGKITPSGAITEYPLPQSFAAPNCVALGSDGNVWFADPYNNVFGKITPSGTITEYPEPANGYINAIAPGPDGNLWMSDQNNNAIDKVSTSGKILAAYTIPTAKADPYGLTAGPDGNIWFTEFAGGKIGRVTPSGTFAEFTIPSGDPDPIAITAGPDGRMWFAEMGAEAGLGKIGYVTLDGSQVRDFFGDGYHVHDLAFDSTGTLWYVSDQLPFGNQEIGTFAY